MMITPRGYFLSSSACGFAGHSDGHGRKELTIIPDFVYTEDNKYYSSGD